MATFTHEIPTNHTDNLLQITHPSLEIIAPTLGLRSTGENTYTIEGTNLHPESYELKIADGNLFITITDAAGNRSIGPGTIVIYDDETQYQFRVEDGKLVVDEIRGHEGFINPHKSEL